jgi:NADPH:quinone reductase-like Zn-dependent oxidoreductase
LLEYFHGGKEIVMQVIELSRPALDAIRRAEGPEPAPRRGEVLVRMKTASLNYLDVAVANGAYPGANYPVIPLADGAGEVVALGDEVDRVQIGDRVAIHPKALWLSGRGTARNAAAMRGVNLPGALREVAPVAAEAVVHVPDHLSWEQAASLPIAATTAWNALVAGDIGPGRTVLLLGTGGVSIFALQLAKARGAKVIVTSSSDARLARAAMLGADHQINYRQTPGWAAAARELTGGIGVDLVVETGGTATFAQSLAAVRQGGSVFTVGFLSGAKTEVDLMPIIAKAIRVQGCNTGSAETLADAVAAIAAHAIEPIVDRTFGLVDLREAYENLAAGGRHFGKLAVTLDW